MAPTIIHKDASLVQGQAHVAAVQAWGLLSNTIKGVKDIAYLMNGNDKDAKNGTFYTIFRLEKGEAPRAREVLNDVILNKDNRASVTLNVSRSGKALIMFNGDWSKISVPAGPFRTPEMKRFQLDPTDNAALKNFAENLRDAAITLMMHDFGLGAKSVYLAAMDMVKVRAEVEKAKAAEERKISLTETRVKQLEEQLKKSGQDKEVLIAAARIRNAQYTDLQGRYVDVMKSFLGSVSKLATITIPQDQTGPVWNAKDVAVWNRASDLVQGWRGVSGFDGVTLPVTRGAHAEPYESVAPGTKIDGTSGKANATMGRVIRKASGTGLTAHIG